MDKRELEIRSCYSNIRWEIHRLGSLEGKGCKKAKKLLEQALKELEKEVTHINLGDVTNPMYD